MLNYLLNLIFNINLLFCLSKRSILIWYSFCKDTIWSHFNFGYFETIIFLTYCFKSLTDFEIISKLNVLLMGSFIKIFPLASLDSITLSSEFKFFSTYLLKAIPMVKISPLSGDIIVYKSGFVIRFRFPIFI